MQSNRTATTLGLLSIIVWGAQVAISASAVPSLGPLVAGGLVYTIAGGLGLLYQFFWTDYKDSFAKLDRSTFLVCFPFFALNLSMFWLAIGASTSRDQVPELILVNYLWPTFTLLFSIIIVKQSVKAGFYAGIALAAIGLGVTTMVVKDLKFLEFSQNIQDHPRPYLLMLTAALAWGIYSNLTKKHSASMNRLAISLFMLLVGSSLLILSNFSDFQPDYSKRALREVIGIGIADAFAYVFWDIAMRAGNRMLVASFSYFTPLIALAVSCFYLNIYPNQQVVIGALMIIAGAWICSKNVKNQA